MKKYPTDKVEILAGDLETIEEIAYIPTPEACKNFESYLEKSELEFYNALQPGQQLMVRISGDPFRALLMEMGKL